MNEPDSRGGAGVRRAARLIAGICYAGCALLLLSSFVWSAVIDERHGPLLPPAGEQLPGEAPFRFAVLGDNRSRTGVLEGILDHIKTQDVKLILHTGDIVKCASRREFQWLLHELAEEKLTVPFCVAPGNHDVLGPKAGNRASRYRFYEAAFGPRRYWFACANALFVVFDNATYGAGPDDLRWIDTTLEQLRSRYEACFVCMHTPIRDPRPGGDHAMKAGAEALLRILTKHRVSAILAGHIHTYLEDNVGGIPAYITGGAGATRDKPKLAYHYLLCTVQPGGALTVERRDVQGDVMDSDALERTFRVSFPLPVALGTALVLLILGCGISLVGAGSRRRSPAEAGGPVREEGR